MEDHVRIITQTNEKKAIWMEANKTESRRIVYKPAICWLMLAAVYGTQRRLEKSISSRMQARLGDSHSVPSIRRCSLCRLYFDMAWLVWWGLSETRRRRSYYCEFSLHLLVMLRDSSWLHIQYKRALLGYLSRLGHLPALPHQDSQTLGIYQ